MQYDQELFHIKIGKLVSREINGTITAVEKDELEKLLQAGEANRIIYAELTKQSQKDILDPVSKFDGDAAFNRFEQMINIPSGKRSVWWQAAAASVVVIIGFGIYQYQSRDRQSIAEQVKIISDVSPGGNKATLTIANGRVIELDDQKKGEQIIEGGISIINTPQGEVVYTVRDTARTLNSGFNTITTPRGGQYQVRLPDGSRVWLNAASTLTYTASLYERREGKRKVRLSGEAYFQIAKDKAHPFIVSTQGQEIEVLGTHFNVNSYSDEKAIRTTLIEGSVRIHPLHLKTPDKVLKPGERAMLASNSISVSHADTESVLAWKNGLFAFNDADVPTIMRQLSRWYNIEVEYRGAIPKDLFTGGISRTSNLATVLKMLELIKIKYEIVETATGKKLIIKS